MTLFEAQDTLVFPGRTYWHASSRRDWFERECWGYGIIPICGPETDVDLVHGDIELTNSYRFADLSGWQTETALLYGHYVASECRSMIQLRLL